jgi:D-alanyl-D-alanine carboxypeptidase
MANTIKGLSQLILAGILFQGLHASAASLRAECFVAAKNGSLVEGLHIDQRLPIASVSKVLTAHWAIAALGKDYRFQTKIHITPLAEGGVDVHLEGGNDPYFSLPQFQYLATELNKMGITRIREMTFDEDMQFLMDARRSEVAIGHWLPNDPSRDRVMKNLRAAVTNIKSNFTVHAKEISESAKIKMPKTVELKVGNIEFRPQVEYQKQETTKSYTMKSITLDRILKEMNRNSNNYSAEVIFRHLGGVEKYHEFIDSRLTIDREKLRFVNGSGNRVDHETLGAQYNEASCSTVLRVLVDLESILESQGGKLQDVMSIAGEDARGESSTVTRIYSNDSTTSAVIAKTGTVNPVVTLAGLGSTQQGEIYFTYIMGTNGSRADWTAGRGEIRRRLISMMNENGGAKNLEYTAYPFVEVDQGSLLVEEAKVIVGDKS